MTAAASILASATLRTETRGAHARSDYPEASDRWRRRIVHTGAGVTLVGGTVPPPHGSDRRPRRGGVRSLTAAVRGPRRRRPAPTSTVDPPRAAVVDAVARAIAEDVLPLGDLTAAPGSRRRWWPRRPSSAAPAGVIAGRACAIETFTQIDPALTVDWRKADGAAVEPGDSVAGITGPLRSILTAERTALNFLGHLSGVASLTRRYVDAVAGANPATRVLDTRKTTPGLRSLEKAAVRAGGGHNHRGSLSEAVLIKDNHLGGVTIAEAVAGPGTCGRAGWSRSSATGSTRLTKRSVPGPPSSCSTT